MRCRRNSPAAPTTTSTRCARWLPALHAEGLVDAVDAFCERIAFTPAQTRRVFDAARALGLPVKLHAEQLSDQRRRRAGRDVRRAVLRPPRTPRRSRRRTRWRAAGTVAVLLPGAFYFLRETQLPPVQALRDAGVPIAMATDHNPGSSPALSLLLMLNMACTLFRLTPEEALRGVTVNAARALGLHDRGVLRAGAARRLRRLGCRAPERAGLLVRPQPAVAPHRRRQSSTRNESNDLYTLHRGHAPLLVSVPHVGTRIPDDAARCVRAARARRRGHRLVPRPPLRLRPRPRRQPARAALQPLRDRPEPAAATTRRCTPAATTPSCARRASSPASRCTARAARRTPDADRAACRRPTGSRTTTRWQAELERLAAQHGHAVLFDGHSIKSRTALAVRRPAAGPEPRHRRRRQLRAVAARAAGARC